MRLTVTELPFAEDVNYWKTSKSSPDIWMERCQRQIEGLGGEVLGEGFGREPQSGRAGYMLAFQIGDEQYKVIWPVLPSKSGNDRAARVQATTLLYHDIKAKAISAAVLGARAAFFTYLALPDGRVAADIAAPELVKLAPALLAPIIDGREI